MGYHRAGFEVVGVDIEPQPHYPFDFYEGDALDAFDMLRLDAWLDDQPFDAVHASPPCQAHTAMKTMKSARQHPELVEPTRRALIDAGLPYVIENVPGAPLIDPVRLCGSAFNLGVRRHRLFETNFPMMGAPCAHGHQNGKFRVYEHGRWYTSPTAKVYGLGGGKAMDRWGEAMDIDWMTHKEMAQAIPPAYTEHIGDYLLKEIEARKAS